jgi:hypothetical protein
MFNQQLQEDFLEDLDDNIEEMYETALKLRNWQDFWPIKRDIQDLFRENSNMFPEYQRILVFFQLFYSMALF